MNGQRSRLERRDTRQRVSREEVAYHSQPAPEAQPPMVNPFPPGVMSALWLGTLVGALVGLLLGYFIFQGILPVEGWEGLFSMTPFTFHMFWVFAGAAAGPFVGGVIGIVTTPSSPITDDKESNHE